MSLHHRLPELLILFAAGRGDPPDGERAVTAAMSNDGLLTAMLVSLAARLDDLCVPPGDPATTRYAIEHDGQAAATAAEIVRRLDCDGLDCGPKCCVESGS